MAVGDCSVTERRRWRPPYQTGKTVHVHAQHYKHNEDGRMAPGVCGNGSIPLSHSGNVITRIGTQTHTHTTFCLFASLDNKAFQKRAYSQKNAAAFIKDKQILSSKDKFPFGKKEKKLIGNCLPFTLKIYSLVISTFTNKVKYLLNFVNYLFYHIHDYKQNLVKR